MKKTLVACAIAAATSIAATGALAAMHGGFGGGGHFSGGGGHFSGGGGHFGGGHFSGGGGHFHGGHFHGGFRGGVFVGIPAFWWPAYYGYGYPYPYYDYYDYPYTYYDYAPSTTYIERAPSPGAQVQYYCPDTGYYPAVRACPRGWLRVLPDGGPPQQ